MLANQAQRPNARVSQCVVDYDPSQAGWLLHFLAKLPQPLSTSTIAAHSQVLDTGNSNLTCWNWKPWSQKNLMRYDAVAPSVPQYEYNGVPNFGSGVRSRVAGGGEHYHLSVWALVESFSNFRLNTVDQTRRCLCHRSTAFFSSRSTLS